MVAKREKKKKEELKLEGCVFVFPMPPEKKKKPNNNNKKKKQTAVTFLFNSNS